VIPVADFLLRFVAAQFTSDCCWDDYSTLQSESVLHLVYFSLVIIEIDEQSDIAKEYDKTHLIDILIILEYT
jgi:hypothetical protein